MRTEWPNRFNLLAIWTSVGVCHGRQDVKDIVGLFSKKVPKIETRNTSDWEFRYHAEMVYRIEMIEGTARVTINSGTKSLTGGLVGL